VATSLCSVHIDEVNDMDHCMWVYLTSQPGLLSLAIPLSVGFNPTRSTTPCYHTATYMQYEKTQNTHT